MAAASIGAAWVVSLVAVLSPSLRHQWIEPWSIRYLVLAALPTLLLGGLALGTSIAWRSAAQWFERHRILGNVMAVAIVGVAGVWVSRFPTSRRQIAVVLLVAIVSLIWMSLATGRSELLLSASSLALLVVAFALFEVVDRGSRPVVWGEPSTMERTFPRNPPFIGPGGRLNPNLSNWMARSGIQDLDRVWLETNRLGFRNEAEFEGVRPDEQITILSLGDSFSNGFGIGQQDFYGARLEALLRASESQVRVWNAEVSDPCYGLRFLQDFGFDYRPDLIVLNLSGNDTLQALWGCGSETGVFRLEPDGRLAVRSDGEDRPAHTHARWQHYRYHRAGDEAVERSSGFSSRRLPALGALGRLRLIDRLRSLNPPILDGDGIVRNGELTVPSAPEQRASAQKLLFDGFPSLGMAYREDLPPKEESLALLFRLLEAMDRGARKSGAGFMVVYFPQRHQVQDQDWDVLRRRWELDPGDFELSQEARRIGEFCEAQGIAFVDLGPAFRQAAEKDNLYLPYDGHPNELGHGVAAAEVARRILGEGRLNRGARAAAPETSTPQAGQLPQPSPGFG